MKNVRAEMENYILDFEGFLVSEMTKKCVGTSHYWPKLKKMWLKCFPLVEVTQDLWKEMEESEV